MTAPPPTLARRTTAAPVLRPRHHPFICTTLATLQRATLIALFPLLGCGQARIVGEVDDPSAPAGIVRESLGGIASLRVRLTLDSATRSWGHRACAMHSSVDQCNDYRAQGLATEAARDSLFSVVRSADFRALRSRYPAPANVADGMAHSLTITTEGRTRTITWGDGARIPESLRQVSDAFSVIATPVAR